MVLEIIWQLHREAKYYIYLVELHHGKCRTHLRDLKLRCFAALIAAMLWTWNIKLLENSFDLQSAVANVLSDEVAYFVRAQMGSYYSDMTKKKMGERDEAVLSFSRLLISTLVVKNIPFLYEFTTDLFLQDP